MKEDETEEGCEQKRGFWIYLFIALGLTLLVSLTLDWFVDGVPLGFLIPVFNEPATISNLIYHVSIVLAGGYIGYIGLKELIVERRFSVEFLMTVAAFGALYLDLLFEATTVLFLYSLAEYFEDYIEDRARKTVEKLCAYMPELATIIVAGQEKTTRVIDIEPNMTLLIRPGESIPLDGVIVDGSSYVDQSIVTGESAPVFRKRGDVVYACTLNSNGVLKVKVTKKQDETLVSRIVKLVAQSRKRKAVIERLVDRFSRIYVPIVISLAIFTAFFMPRIISGPAETWIYRSLILLVISCPSAFIISVPATMFTAITVAARKGVIIKGGIYMEKMSNVKAVIFDKTGTLTFGELALDTSCSFNNDRDRKYLSYAAALEQYSNHPIAHAVIAKATEEEINFKDFQVKDVQETAGKGIFGYVNGTQVAVGNKELMKELDIASDARSNLVLHKEHSLVFLAIDGRVVDTFCLVDRPRNDAVEAVKSLKDSGIHVAMLTGDRAKIAEAVSRRLGVDDVHAELLPEDKLKILEQMRGEYGMVSMVGDGVNDAPALAASDVGIAMGGKGIDVALESADVVLVKDELLKVPEMLKLSRKAMRIAKENITVSLGVKLLIGVLGFLGLVPLWFAVASGDDGVTMLLLLNNLRLTRAAA